MRPHLLIAAALFALAGCDWDQAALLNSVPLSTDVSAHPRLEVYLGVDGFSADALAAARERGAFKNFESAVLVPMFPATSDASWTRLLRAPKLRGYEYTHFDPERDAIVHEGLSGLLGHAIPPAQFDADFPYYRGFDFHGAGYIDAMEDYTDPIASFRRGLDDMFTVLGGRVGRADVVTAYLVEPDVAAHGQGRDVMVDMLVALSSRIDAFAARYPSVDIRFTLMSDHGNDHTSKVREVVAKDLAQRTGVTLVKSMAEGANLSTPWGIAVEHTRTTYGVIHSLEAQAEAIAQRLSLDDTVELTVAKAQAPPGAPTATGWTSLYRNGMRIARFGVEAETGRTWLDRDGDWAFLGIRPPSGNETWSSRSDRELFEETESGPFPDVLFRARTALEDKGIRFPAQVLYSLKADCVMRGIPAPGASSMGGSGSHGSLSGGSRGVLLTQSRLLPRALRSDDLVDLFPDLAQRLSERFER